MLATFVDGRGCGASCAGCPACRAEYAAMLAESPEEQCARWRRATCHLPVMQHNAVCAARRAEDRTMATNNHTTRLVVADPPKPYTIALAKMRAAGTLPGAVVASVAGAEPPKPYSLDLARRRAEQARGR